MNLIALPAFTDNYIWMLHDGVDAIVVDPGDSAPVIGALTSQELTLAGILVTHHHSDHVGGLEPGNDALAAHTRWCEQLRAKGAPTLPSSVAQERMINPFLRCAEPAVVQAACEHGAASTSGTDVFAALRRWKNNFR